MPCLLGEPGVTQSICVICKVRSGQGRWGGHRLQLWKEGSGVPGVPAVPWGPQLQHWKEKKGTRGDNGRGGAPSTVCAQGPARTQTCPAPEVLCRLRHAHTPTHVHARLFTCKTQLRCERSHRNRHSWNILPFRQEQLENLLVIRGHSSEVSKVCGRRGGPQRPAPPPEESTGPEGDKPFGGKTGREGPQCPHPQVAWHPQASRKLEGAVALLPQLRCGPSRGLHEHSGLLVRLWALTRPLPGPTGSTESRPSPCWHHTHQFAPLYFSAWKEIKLTVHPRSVCLCCWVVQIRGPQQLLEWGVGRFSQGWAPGSLGTTASIRHCPGQVTGPLQASVSLVSKAGPIFPRCFFLYMNKDLWSGEKGAGNWYLLTAWCTLGI